MPGNDPGPSTRPSLLMRVRDPQDVEAWNTFVDVYGPLVHRHCLRRGLQHADADDVTQQVFVQVSRAIRRLDYRPEHGRFRDWLGVVTRNAINRFWKKQAGEVRATGDPDDLAALDAKEAPEQDTEWIEQYYGHLLRTAMTRIRPHFKEATWRAFEIVWVDKRTAAEAAAQLGMSIDDVYSAKSHVLKRLREEIEYLADRGDDLAG